VTAPTDRDRDGSGRARNARPRDPLGRPLPRGAGSAAAHDEPALTPAKALERAQQLLDNGEPFAAHEVLEAVWKQTTGTNRELWRGLAQVAVGITHALRGNESGARALLSRGESTLSSFAATTPYDIDVNGVRKWARAASIDLTLVADPPRLLVRGP
jgi:uncharacterized protein